MAREIEKKERLLRLERAAETPGTPEHAEKYPIADWREIGTFNNANLRHKAFFDKLLYSVRNLKESESVYERSGNAQTLSITSQRLTYNEVSHVWQYGDFSESTEKNITVTFEGSIVLASRYHSDRCIRSSDDDDYYEPRVTSSRSLVLGEWIDFVPEQSG